MEGKFVVIEGANGTGKTSLIGELKPNLERNHIKYCLTKEPTTSELGSLIRKNQNDYKGELLAMLVAANRYEHLQKIIEPKILEGFLVISDRYVPSSLVYQTMDGVPLERIMELNRNILIPDLIILLTVNPEELSMRISQREDITRFEIEDVKRFEIAKYEEAYTYLVNAGYKTCKIDSSKMSVSELAEIVFYEILKIM